MLKSKIIELMNELFKNASYYEFNLVEAGGKDVGVGLSILSAKGVHMISVQRCNRTAARKRMLKILTTLKKELR